MRMVAEVPGCPEVLITDTPATSPVNALERLETFLLFKSSPVICFADPVKASLVDVLYPTTTISFSVDSVVFKLTLITL